MSRDARLGRRHARRSARGGQRFLTDVIVELGSPTASRSSTRSRRRAIAGTTPEEVLLAAAASLDARAARARDRRALRPRPPRPRASSRSTWRRPTSSPPPRPSATRRCPVAFVDERTLLVAMADPANVLAVDDIALMTGYEVRPAVASREDIARADRAPDPPRRRRRRARVEEDERRARAEIVDLRETRRRRAGHQARQRDHRPGRRAGRLRHPLRARRQGDARALPHRRRAARDARRSRGAWSPASSRA